MALRLSVVLTLLSPVLGISQDVPAVDYIDSLWSEEQAKIIKSHKTDHIYEGFGKTKNLYTEFSFPDGSIGEPLVIVTGLEDPIPLWFDFVLIAKDYGFRSIYIIELRGQGQSERVAGPESRVIHVNDFNNYFGDLVLAFKDIDSKKKFEQPVYIINHSTGSLITVKALKPLKEALPHLRIAKMSLWGPLVKLKISPFLDNFIMRPLLDGVESLYAKCCGILMGRKYGRSDFNKNGLTTDSEKFKMIEVLKYDYQLGSSGVSLRWGIEALKQAKDFVPDHLEKIDFPVLILKAGKDHIVDNNFKVKNKNVQSHTIAGAMHALHIEQESQFKNSCNKTFDFFGLKKD